MKRVFAFVGFSMAIVLIILNLLNPKYAIYVMLGLVAVFVASLALPKYRQAKVVPLSVGAALLACLLFCINYSNVLSPQLALDGAKANSVLYVTDYEGYNGKNYAYIAKTKVIEQNGAPQEIKVRLYSKKYIEPYEMVKGNVSYYSSYDNAFQSCGDYADSVYMRASCNNLMSTGEVVKSPLKPINSFRQSICDVLTSIIGGDEGAFSAAVVTGDRSYITDEVKSYFKSSGTYHIMAISGVHLSIIIGGFLYILKKLKVNEKLASLLGIVLTLFYMSLAAFSGSIVRAGIMLIVLLLGKMVSMRADTLNSLGIAVSVMCLNPFAVTDIGAMYSVLAILAISTIYPALSSRLTVRYMDPLDKKLSEKIQDKIKGIVTAMATGTAITLFSLPIQFVFFGYTSIAGPVANLIAMPFGSACLVLSIITYFVSLTKIKPLVLVVASITKHFDFVVISNAEFFGSFRGSIVYLDRSFGVALMSALLVLSVGFLLKNKKMIRSFALASLCVLVVVSSALHYGDESYSRAYVFKNGAILVEYNDKTIVAGVDSFEDFYSVKSQLNSRGRSVDVIVVPDEFYYSMLLCDNVNVNILLVDYFDEAILTSDSFQKLEVQNYYNLALEENLVLWYNQGEITVTMDGFSISNYDFDSNVVVDDEFIYDDYGVIELTDGDIVYTIEKDNIYNARRINQWQK